MKSDVFAKISRQSGVRGYVTAACTVLLLLFTTRVQAAERQVLRGHVPAVVSRLQPMSNFAGTNRLNLAIGLPLQNQEALANLLQQIYDPASPNYRHYLTPEQFTEQFGPTEKDYEAVIAFAKAHGLSVTATHPNRMLVDVNGSVADIEKTMHVKMRVYQHPTEKRMFHAPDTEPSLDLATPILRISGLNNYSLPRPRLVATPLAKASKALPNAGSGPGGTYMGHDFRAAYAPDTLLTGTGQMVGLLQFDGYTASDITYYESNAGLPNVTLTNVLLDGFDGTPSGQEIEVSLDIEDAISMAPGLSEVIVYEAGPDGIWEDILNRMADDNLAKQLSCSWYSPDTGADPVADQIWQQMAAQGQSFFNASGDYNAYTGLIPFPGDTPYITQVGGTTLTTSGPGGAWVSETVWNQGDYGSGGGISTQYPIPSWQANIDMTANHGSTTMRNTPDVALTAYNVYVRCDGKDVDEGGTSCAAPLWAGFTALVNQQAAASGKPAVGFVNPVVYAIGSGINVVNYTSAFHDITTGNNYGYYNPTNFPAVPGYDLCTGWGTPAGQNLINALVNPEALSITPGSGFTSVGGVGGPFTITSQSLSLTNAGTNSLTWTLVNTSLWLNASPDGGTLMPGGPASTVTVSLNAAASNLVVGTYTATLWFTNLNSGVGQSLQFTLAIGVPPSITTITTEPTNQTVMAGGTATFSAGATGTPPMHFQWQNNGTNLADGWNISGSTTATLVLRSTTANDAGNYTVVATNTWGSVTSSIVTLTVVSPIVSQPRNLIVTNGSPASFSISVFDLLPLSFQWQKNGTNLTDGGNISGSLTTNLLLSSATTNDDGNYTVVVTCLYGSVTSSVASLTVVLPPVITTEPTNQTVMFGGTATFSVAVSGTGPFICQWQLNGTNLPSGIITTVAGNGSWGYTGDGSAATNASLNAPQGVAVDASGNLFFADTANNVIRKVDTNGIITTVVGNGNWGYSGDGGPATNATMYSPYGVAMDTSGNLFIADMNNNVIRKVDTNGIITTVAGNGTNGYSGDGGAAINASLNFPSCVTVDASGNLFIADTGNDRIRKVDPNGIITTVAGNGYNSQFGGGGYSGDGGAATNAALYWPYGMAEDASGNLFLADEGNFRIRKVDANGIITTVAGNGSYGYSGDGGAATNASLGQPTDVVVDAFGNLFIADWYNNDIRKVGANGIITTVAGNGLHFYSGDGGAATNTSLSPPAVVEDVFCNLFIADTPNERIRKVVLFGNPTLALDNVTPNNAGNYTVIITSPYGSVTSSIVTLTVMPSPTIVSQPRSLAVTPGSTASFSVSVFYTLPLSFQWQKNGVNLTDGGNISGSATTNLFLSNATTNDAGNYTVVITCLYGSVTSSVASLAVGFPPVITTEPTNQMVLAGGAATFSVAASGIGPFSYQWRLNGTNLPNGTITTVAGNGINLYSGDGGAATNACLNYPSGMAEDAFGNLFIADSENNRIRKVAPNGIITTVAGNGSYGYSGDGGAAISAGLSPAGVAVDAFGNLFIADWYNNDIRKVDTNGIITTVAGNGSYGYSGDGGAATNASLWGPSGVAVDASGNLFLADEGNYRIRKVDTNGIITTVAGNGSYGYSGDGGAATNACIFPEGVAVDASDNLFIADLSYNRIRKVDTNGIIMTVAGNGATGYTGDGGAATNASLNSPCGVAVDANGNLFIVDKQNNRIRKVNAKGIITTVAGNGASGYSGDGGAATSAGLDSPAGVGVGANGNLFIADTDNNRIREVMLFSYPTLALGNVTPNNAGNYTVIITSPYGSVTSSIVTLTVVSPIVSQPQSLVVSNGSTASFSVSVFDLLPLSFQWQKNGVNLTNGGNISGSLTTNLFLSSVTTNDDGNYTVIVTCLYGSVTSSVARLAVALPPVIATEPTNQTVMVGGVATFSVAVSGTGPFTYQWHWNGANLPNGIITTVAGNYAIRGGYSGDGGMATNASLNLPEDVVMDASGNLFIADKVNFRIRKVGANGIITTVAGNGTGGYSGDGGAATNASLNYPYGVTVDASGNLFIADTYNNRIRKVDPNGIITTVAGNGTGGYSGDGGAATNASLNYPYGVTVDASGNLFIADTYNSVIRKVDADGIITTVAGNYAIGGNYSGDGGAATNASLCTPYGVSMDASGNLFIADKGNGRIRKVDANGIITTVAGNGTIGYFGNGGAATNASLYLPYDVAVDALGNLFIADFYNDRIRKVDANGIITTVAGNGYLAQLNGGGYSGDGGAATNASLYWPAGVTVDASGNLFIADQNNSCIREVMLFSCPTLSLFNVTTNNAGNYTVIITSPYGSITSSIVTLTVASSPFISKVIYNVNGSVTFNLLTTPNTSSRVLVTTNLAPPAVWQPICTNVTGANGAWQFTDMNASNFSTRFYRSSTP